MMHVVSGCVKSEYVRKEEDGCLHTAHYITGITTVHV